MAVREYKVRGYRNTGYRPGTIDSTEFDRPLSKAVFEGLYPDGDDDVMDLQESKSKFLLRSIYYKDSIKIEHDGTQKDIIFQVDYLRIQAVNGGDNRECAYYFVDTARTEFLGNKTVVLYLTLDEQTTADATQTVNINGVIEKRNIHSTETCLNWYKEDFTPSDPLTSHIAYITAEDASGYTVTSGIAKVSGTITLAAVYCDLGQLLASTPVVADLPSEADRVTFTIEGSNGSTFDVPIDGMALVDVNNTNVKKALNRLRELNNEFQIGSTYNFPKQCLKVTTKYTSNGVDLITGISGGSFIFTVDNLNIIPTYNGYYSQLVNKKAAYQFTAYSLTAPSSNESKTFTLQEIIASATGTADLTSEQIKFMGTGNPMSGGSIYWKPENLTLIKTVPGYDKRIAFVSTVRGSDWNSDGLTLTGVSNIQLLSNQLSVAKQQKSLDSQQIDRQLELTKANIDQARLQSSFGLAGSVAGVAGNLIGGNVVGAIGSAFSAAPQVANRLGMTMGSDGSIGSLGDTYNRQEKIAQQQADLAKKTNALGLSSVQFGYDYAKNTQNLAVQPPTGLDMNRIMGTSLLITRTTLSPADVKRYDLYLTWRGTTVQETYNGKLVDHDYLLDAGEDFSYLKLGLCTLSLPNDPSGWANSLAWRSKIQAEMQTGGRYWKKKILDYVWKQPIPVDDGYTPGQAGGTDVYFESMYAQGTNTTKSLELTLSEVVTGLSSSDITLTGATKGAFTALGGGQYDLKISGFNDGDTVTVKISKAGYTFLPSSKSVTVIKELVAPIGGSVSWGSPDETMPALIGYTIKSECQISNGDHFILWGNNTNNYTITHVVNNMHTYVRNVTISGGSIYKGICLIVVNGILYIIGNDGRYEYIWSTTSGALLHTYDNTLVSSLYETGNVSYGNRAFKKNFRVVGYYDNQNYQSYMGGTVGMQPVIQTYNLAQIQFVAGGTNEILVSTITPQTNGSGGSRSDSTVTIPATVSVGSPITAAGLGYSDYGTKGLVNFLLGMVVDTNVIGVGAVYESGLYVQRSSGWYWHSNDGTEQFINAMPPTASTLACGLAYSLNGSNLVRVSGV